MPSSSPSMHNTMEMALHDPAKARALGFHIPPKVAAEFVEADQAKGWAGRMKPRHVRAKAKRTHTVRRKRHGSAGQD